MFNVLFSQAIIEGFPLEIKCFDQVGNKLFIITTDGSLLEYTVEEDPFSITLIHVHKRLLKGIINLKIMSKTQSVAVLQGDGFVGLIDFSTSAANIVPLTSIKGASCISRCSINSGTELLAVGVKRGVVVFKLSSYEAVECPIVKLPSTPNDIHFVSSSSVVISTKSGIYMVNHEESSSLKLFSVPSESIFSSSKYILSVLAKWAASGDESIERQDPETSVYCTVGGQLIS